MTTLMISVHIPKTGGSSFKDLLQKIAGKYLFIDKDDMPLASNYTDRRLQNFQADFERCKNINELLKLNEEQLIIIHGHFLASKYSHIYPKAQKVVWLRDPVERIISHYYYWQRRPDMKNNICIRMIQENMTLEEFAQLEPLRNIYKRFLNSIRIDSFDFVGITEKYERSLSLFSKIFQCGPDKSSALPHSLKNPDKKGRFYQIDQEVREEIKRMNKHDCEIYHEAQKYFDSLCEKYTVS